MSEIEWSEETSRAYARYMETNVRYDHRRWARRIAADWPSCPAGATVVDIGGGPAFLLLEVAPLLEWPRLVLADGSATMVGIAHERALARGMTLEGHVCPAEALDLRHASADLVLCKHLLRLSADVDGVLREIARILKPGGHAYLIDFNAERPQLTSALLRLWISLTAPAFIRSSFGKTMKRGLPASKMPGRMTAAGFRDAAVLSSGVSYLVRGVR